MKDADASVLVRFPYTRDAAGQLRARLAGLTRAELRALCDKHGTRDEILRALDAR